MSNFNCFPFSNNVILRTQITTQDFVGVPKQISTIRHPIVNSVVQTIEGALQKDAKNCTFNEVRQTNIFLHCLVTLSERYVLALKLVFLKQCLKNAEVF